MTCATCDGSGLVRGGSCADGWRVEWLECPDCPDCNDAAEVEAWLREQPSDLAAARIEICAVSGDYMVLDQFGRVLKRECDGAAAYLWLREAQQFAAQPVAA
jgi:hypothetical protein